MKKVHSALVSCIFILFLLHQPAASGVPPTLSPITEEQAPGRQLPRKLKLAEGVLADREKRKVKESHIEASSGSFGQHNDDEEKSLIDTADYQVVTTHISPSPKHPNP